MNTDKQRQLSFLFYLCSSVFIGGFIFGCHAPPKQQIVAWNGPTDPINKVVAEINRNADQIPTLRGAGSFEARISDQKQKHFVNGQITLLYQRPGSMRLVGKKDIAGTIFDLGSNDERYWVIIRGGDEDTMWTGTWKNIDKVDPKQIPIRPDLLLEVLGVQSINTNLLEQPVPVMRFNSDNDAYMLVWNVKLPDRWVAQKEIWYDRQTKLPKLVNLYDENGRVVLSAYLSKHKPVEVSGVPEQQWPKVATNYNLLFPQNQSSMQIDLDDVALKRNNAPNEKSFTYPGPKAAGVSRVIDLDEQTSQ